MIDSESTDGTGVFLDEVAQADCRIRILRVRRAEYGHGRTRNLGVSIASGEYIVMITQDACPVGRDWLKCLVGGVDRIPEAAGGFGRHVPWPNSSPFVARDLEWQFNDIASACSIRAVEDWRVFRCNPAARASLCFFSDNNACLRRCAWMKCPYPDVDFGEDQLWALEVLRMGGKIVYVDQARVMHAHSYGAVERYKRTYVEARYFAERFDYKICCGIVAMVRSALALCWRDLLWVVYNPKVLFSKSWHWCLSAALIDFAVAFGQWRGSRVRKMNGRRN